MGASVSRSHSASAGAGLHPPRVSGVSGAASCSPCLRTRAARTAKGPAPPSLANAAMGLGPPTLPMSPPPVPHYQIASVIFRSWWAEMDMGCGNDPWALFVWLRPENFRKFPERKTTYHALQGEHALGRATWRFGWPGGFWWFCRESGCWRGVFGISLCEIVLGCLGGNRGWSRSCDLLTVSFLGDTATPPRRTPGYLFTGARARERTFVGCGHEV
jgi:hypothetical protein